MIVVTSYMRFNRAVFEFAVPAVPSWQGEDGSAARRGDRPHPNHGGHQEREGQLPSPQGLSPLPGSL